MPSVQATCCLVDARPLRAHACFAEGGSRAWGNFFCRVVTSLRVSNGGGGIMILGMSTATFVLVPVVISLIAIVAGVVVMFAMLGSQRRPGLTAIFLLLTMRISATGCVIPPLMSEKLLPSHMIGLLSLALLAVACIALYVMRL